MAAIVWNAPIPGSMAVCNLDEDARASVGPFRPLIRSLTGPLPKRTTALLDAKGPEWRERANAG